MAIAILLAPIFVLLQSIGGTGQALTMPSSTAHYTLRGSVVNSLTGEPVRRAQVSVNGPDTRQVFTGPDGQFEVPELPGGTYQLSARRPGFVDANSPNGPPATQWFQTQLGQNIVLGSDTSPAVIKLIPQARISGRVLDPEGEPVPNLNVQCLQQTLAAGHKRWTSVQMTNTDDAGNFSIDSLTPGKVVLTTQQQQVYPGLIADDQASRLIYPKVYYPNSPDLGSAQPIDLNPGQEAQADMTVPVVRGTRVFFSVSPPQQWVQASLMDSVGDEVQSQVRPNARNGGWILPSVPPGQWRLIVRGNGGEPIYGEADINVGEADLRNVVVGLSATMQVPLLISGGTPDNTAHPVDVQLVSVAPGSNGGYPIMFGQDGQKLTGVTPGTYHLLVNATGSDCIGSVTSGETDLTRSEYKLASSGSPGPINIVLRSDCANLEISTNGRSTQPGAIVVSGGPHSLEPKVIFVGGSTTTRLSPGDYDLYAFSDVNGVEYANPEVLKSFSGQHISVSPNQNATVHLDLITPGEGR